LFIAGDRDPNLRTVSPEGIAAFLPRLSKSVLLPGCGHWVQQERPAEVTATMLEFLAALP
jgi:pimeloyl-ACP methyl ester carboxylesterase